MSDRSQNKHGPKRGGLLCPFQGGGLDPRLTQCGMGRGPPSYTKWHLDPSSRLSTIEMGRKLGWALPPFWGGRARSPSNTISLGQRPISLPRSILIHPAIWPQQIWAENWGVVPLWERRAGSLSNSMWPGPRPICVPSFILIHPTV